MTGCQAESAEYTSTYVQVAGMPPRILPSELSIPRDVAADEWDVICGAWLIEPSIDDWQNRYDPLLDPWWQVGWAYDATISADVLILPVTPLATSFDFSLFY